MSEEEANNDDVDGGQAKGDTTEVSGADAKKKTDQNEIYSLKVKKQFIVDQRPSSLGDLPPENTNGDARQQQEDNNEIDNGGGSNRKKRKKRGKKRNHNVPQMEKVCLSVLRGDPCPYKEKCKFSHDLSSYLASRPSDFEITTIEGGCPSYNETGYCVFGATCRLGSCHIIKETGENLRKDNVMTPPPIQNILSKEIINQLRKRTYPFKCQRMDNAHRRKNKNNNDDSNKDKQNDNSNLEKEEMTQSTDAGKNNEPNKADAGVDANVPPSTSEDVANVTNNDTKTSNSFENNKNNFDFKPDFSAHDAFRPSIAQRPERNDPIPTKRKIIDFSNKVYVAPLTTVGNLPFRRIMKKFGADITCGEMALASNLLDGRPSEWALLKRHPEEDIFGVQIASGFPDQYTRICEVIEAHMDVDFVDLNLGCPLDIICDKGAGAALMTRDKRLKGALEGLSQTLSCPFTIKMRTGMDISRPFAHKLVPKIQRWGIDGIGAIMVHGRSRLQRYQRSADWDYISKVAQSQDPNLPRLDVIGNGDIFSFTG